MSRVTAAFFALLLALLVVACGGDDDSGDDEVVVGQRVTVGVEGTATEPAETGKGGIEALAKLPALERAQGEPASPALRGVGNLTLPEYLDTVNQDVAAYWKESFAAGDLPYAPPGQVIYEQPFESACGEAIVESAFYCPNDRTVYLPIPYFTPLIESIGDAAGAIPVAHENGHHVQDLLGIFDNPRLRSIDIELMADCLAGVWASSVYQRGLLEPGDIEEALQSRSAVGDPETISPEHPGAHGTPPERVNAFTRGYRFGDGRACT
jgi:uncharacterized protein